MDSRLLKVKDAHRPVALPGDRIAIGLMQYGIAAEIQDDEQHSIERLLELLDGSRDVETVCRDFRVTHPMWETGSVIDVIDQLYGAGYLEVADAELPEELSVEEARRYDRSRHYFAWIDTTPRSSPYEIQARLKRSRVTVLGLGGAGSAVAAGLVATGVGAVHGVDFDVVEESNLSRQLFYAERDVGRPKVATAVDRLKALNSWVEVSGDERKVSSPEDLVDLMRGSTPSSCAPTSRPDLSRTGRTAPLSVRERRGSSPLTPARHQ